MRTLLYDENGRNSKTIKVLKPVSAKISGGCDIFCYAPLLNLLISKVD